MDIKKILLPQDKLKPLYADALKLQFGRQFTDHMFAMQWDKGQGWHDPEIRPYGPLLMDPAANVLHYGQEVFEGMKAYRSPSGEILLFRPDENARRINNSLRRICMPEIPVEDFMQAVGELVKLEQRWIPTAEGCSLYIRPAAIGTEAALGVRPADQYLFFVILSPVGPYFPEGFNPVGLWVSDNHVRAALGGTGEAKTGGNYAGSLFASQQAKERGYNQVLWLDAKERRYIEEVGAMNIFFVLDNVLITPPLSGSILNGVTRRSVLKLADDVGIRAEQRQITIDEAVDGIKYRKLTECFGSGTAAVISPVGKISYKGQEYVIGGESGPWARKLYETLTGIQTGRLPDKYGWVHKL
ncbi:MAG: branched-chain amino acid aminotransferase [Candidatus Edwardsbacteria bacterium]|nr:branched-chain amino acid aminotransferase [Candidatus Edwardsbacteria bacterium]